MKAKLIYLDIKKNNNNKECIYKDKCLNSVFINLNIKSFEELFRMFVDRFCSRIIYSNNLLISSTFNLICRIYSILITLLINNLITKKMFVKMK